MLIHLDYLWVDGFDHPALRSKTKMITLIPNENGEVELKVPEWNFDGSSTGQAPTEDSERILKPKRMFQVADNHYVAMCEVCLPDTDRTPHETNYRAKLRKAMDNSPITKELWIGFEQEYFFTSGGNNIFWPTEGEPIRDQRYYCSSGGNVKCRKLVREHASFCNNLGIGIMGYNAEVSPGQWEYQCFASDPLEAADALWVSRYLLELMTEDLELGIDWHPKPHNGWNGSGCHTNFSTKEMRESGGKELFESIITNMEKSHHDSISEYGTDNGLRLTGGFETASLHTFSYGIASRGTSVRIPNSVPENDWCGYLEDRRPSSGCDPYRVVLQVCKFISG